MSTTRILLAAIAASMALAPGPYAGADAQRLRDQDAAFKEAQRGKIMPLPRIERAARERLRAGATDRVPDTYQSTVDRYYRALAQEPR